MKTTTAGEHSGPLSLLTRQQPRLWTAAVGLATSLTGYEYAHKSPAPNGRIYSCSGAYVPPTDPYWQETDLDEHLRKLMEKWEENQKSGNYSNGYSNIDLERWIERVEKDIAERETPEEKADRERKDQYKREIEEIETEITEKQAEYDRLGTEIEAWRENVDRAEKRREELGPELKDLRKRLKQKQKQKAGAVEAAPVVVVPEGAMEWLLHEVGHYVASTTTERAAINYALGPEEYGLAGEREWQAWAFEEIILAPWGPARHFAPPTQRDGAAFAKAGPMPREHMLHAERQMRSLGIDVAQWRAVYGPWCQWEQERVHADR